MAWAYGVKLPLRHTTSDGYEMNKGLKATIKQNLKMLVLTNPGERVMDPNYGVGIMGYLFENFGSNTYQQISTRIREQTSAYMPMVQIVNITFDSSNQDLNRLGIKIVYQVPQIGLQDFLDFTI